MRPPLPRRPASAEPQGEPERCGRNVRNRELRLREVPGAGSEAKYLQAGDDAPPGARVSAEGYLVIGQGEVVTVLEEHTAPSGGPFRHFLKVRSTHGVTGWVLRDDIKELPPPRRPRPTTPPPRAAHPLQCPTRLDPKRLAEVVQAAEDAGEYIDLRAIARQLRVDVAAVKEATRQWVEYPTTAPWTAAELEAMRSAGVLLRPAGETVRLLRRGGELVEGVVLVGDDCDFEAVALAFADNGERDKKLLCTDALGATCTAPLPDGLVQSAHTLARLRALAAAVGVPCDFPASTKGRFHVGLNDAVVLIPVS